MNTQRKPTYTSLIMLLGLLLVAGCSPTQVVEDAEQMTAEPVPTRTAEPTSTITPTIQAEQPQETCDLELPGPDNWQVQLCDSFNDNNNEWQLESQDNPYARYVTDIGDGKLQIDYSAKAFESFTRSAITWFDIGQGGDFALTISGLIDSQLLNTGWGIAFRADDEMRSYYLFSIKNDDTFSLEYNNNNKNWIPFIPSTGHSSIRNADVNTVKITADGDIFTFWINGEQVATFEGVQLEGDLIRLMVSAAEGAGAVFSFDDVVLQTPTS